MKKILLAMGIVCAGLSSCSDDLTDNGQKGTIASPGDEVQFSAFQQKSEYHSTDNPDDKETRAHYGLYSAGSKSYAIYWDNDDRIAIFSPQARATNTSGTGSGREADYKIILEPQEGQQANAMQSGTLSKINPGDVGLQWGNDDFHDFFGFFPHSAKEGVASQTSLRLTLPVLQTPSAMRVVKQGEIENITIPRPGGTTETVTGTTYIARPDMNNCFMYAHGYGYRTKADPISLNFKPIVTTLEVIVRGPAQGEDPIEVSQVVIRSEANICGKFNLNIAYKDQNKPEETPTNDGTVTIVDDGTLSNTITIPVNYNHNIDADGVGATTGNNLAPVKLEHGDVLVVRAFLLPTTVEASQTAVTVHMVGAGTRTKKLNTGSIEAQKINITTMPLLLKSENNFWMTQLDSRTYFSQLSIPGSHNAYNIATNASSVTNDNYTVGQYYQTKSVEEQLADGARAFSFQVGFRDADYLKAITNDGWRATQGTYPLVVYAGGEETSTTLSSVLKTFADEITSLNNSYRTKFPESTRTAQEFIVLNITYTQRVGGDGRQEEIMRWMKELDETIDNHASKDIFTNEISSNTTISELAKKVVIFVNYQGTNWPKKSFEYSTGNRPSTTQTFDYSYAPSTDAETYVVVKDTYDAKGLEITDFSTQNDRDYNYVFYQPVYGNGVGEGIQLWRQNLERLNNTDLTGSDYNWLGDRQTSKKNFIKDLFDKAIANNKDGINIGNWYINNIGSFCVVNKNVSWASDRGEGGNTPMAANIMNQYTYQYLADATNNSAPCGVVLMNFFGETNVAGLDVYSQLLQQIIIDNNYRFALKIRQ